MRNQPKIERLSDNTVCWENMYSAKHLEAVCVIWSQYGVDFVTQLAKKADISNCAALLVYVKCMWQDDCMVVCCVVLI
jgi:hypothetical protein